jgi:TolB-like protein/DNA-binding winged helix-turn-helix (wHTH) protein
MAESDGKKDQRTFQVDWVRGKIGTTQLRPQSLAVFRLLHDRAGQVVSKEDIMSTVWPNVSVTDDSLVQCVTEIRKALADDEHTLVKTLPKRGYIYDPEPKLVAEQGEATHRWWPAAAAAAAIALVLGSTGLAAWRSNGTAAKVGAEVPTVAVLHFNSLGMDDKDSGFADAFTSKVVAELSQAKDLSVIGHNSSDGYNGRVSDLRRIATELRAEYVLLGFLQKSEVEVQAIIQLVDPIDGKSIWAEKIERQSNDVYAVDDEIISRIAQSIGSLNGAVAQHERKQIRTKPESDWSAYDAYQMGLEARSDSNTSRTVLAEGYFRQAVNRDPHYARAYLGLAGIYASTSSNTSKTWDQTREKWYDAVKKAVELDPQDAMALENLASYYRSTCDFEKLRLAATNAMALSPRDPDTLIMLARALNWAEFSDRPTLLAKQAIQLNPMYPDWYNQIAAEAFYFAKQFDDAHSFSQRSKPDTPLQILIASLIAAEAGHLAEAQQFRAELLKQVPGYSQEAYNESWLQIGDTALTEILKQSHRKAGIEICMTKEQLATSKTTFRFPQCDAERSKQP